MRAHWCAASSDPRLVGDPVDTYSGAVVDRMMDFRLTGPIDFRWYRHYDSSKCGRSFTAGNGWAHEFDRTLSIASEGIFLEEPVGRRLHFPPLATAGRAVALHGITLRRWPDGCYRLQRHGRPEMEFVFSQGESKARLRRLLQGSSEVLFRYDARDRLTEIVDSAGRRLQAREDDCNRLLSLVLQPDSGAAPTLLVAYRYDDQGNLVSTENADGHGYRFLYDGSNRLVMRRGRRGFKFRFKYDGQGRCVLAVGDERHYGVALQYAVPGRVTHVTRPDGGVWTYKFNAGGGLEEIRDPLGGSQKIVRDAAGRPTLDIDPNGNAATYQYDGAGEAVAKVDSLGHRTPLPEDPNEPDPLSHRVAANALEYEFGALVDFRTCELPQPSVVATLGLSAPDRSLVVSRLTPAASLGAQTFDVPPLGVLWWPEPASGQVFNEFGKLVQQYDLFGRRRTWSYDESGNESSLIDFDGSRWTYDFGTWHFLRRIVNPLGVEVRFDYTSYGEVSAFVDAGGCRSEYGYDLKDRLIEVRRHGKVRDVYSRDASGNLIAKHDGNGREMLRIDIGPGNLPVRRALASGDVHELTYDASGRTVLARTQSDNVEIAYDAAGRCVSEKRNGLGFTRTYADNEPQSEMTILGRFVVRYRWDARTLSIVDPGGASHQVEFLGHGLIERRLANGTCETAQYDNLGRCLFKCATRLDGRVWSRRFSWSGEGELRQVTDNVDGTTSYEYDAAHRLRRRVHAGRTETFDYDVADNLLAQPGLGGVALLSGNRLSAANGSTFTYNDRDHIETRQRNGEFTRYEYDSRDALVRMEENGNVWTAAYDAFNRRARKSWKESVTEYYWNSDQLIAEIAADGGVRIYVYTDPLAATPILILDYVSMKAPVEQCRRGYLLSDQIGTPQLLEDENGMEIWSAKVEPLGAAKVEPRSSTVFNLRFPGHYFDEETGFHYNRFRYYDPKLGRYIQSDPWGIAGGWNLYAYRTNPLADVDVRGLGEENKKKGKPCSDEEGTLSAGAALAKAKGLPEAPAGYHYADVGGVPRLKRNPGHDGPALRVNSDGKIVEAPADKNYPRVGFNSSERDKVFEANKNPDGKVLCPCGKEVASSSGGDMDMGHKPGHAYAPARDAAIDNGTSPADFRAQQKDLSNYRPEHPSCNRSHEHE